jgi:Spy/CpxP family protein refolding chaperone
VSTSSRTRVALLLAITFVAGLAAGVAADRQILAERGTDGAKQGQEDHRRDRRVRGSTIERFADELGLTGEQRAQIDPILEDTRERMDELFEPVRPQYRDLVDSTRARIESVLTPEQVTEYRRLLEREYGNDHDRSESDEGNEGDTENR